jgi:hypothetical protein
MRFSVSKSPGQRSGYIRRICEPIGEETAFFDLPLKPFRDSGYGNREIPLPENANTRNSIFDSGASLGCFESKDYSDLGEIGLGPGA